MQTSAPLVGAFNGVITPEHFNPTQENRDTMRQSSVVIAVLIVIGMPASCAVGAAMSGGTVASAPTATITVTAPGKASKAKPQPIVTETVTAEPEAPKGAIAEGVWVVGEEVAPGNYKTAEAVSEGCYWMITRSGTNGADIIQNDLPSGGFPRVTLKRGQDFKTQNCGDWIKIK